MTAETIDALQLNFDPASLRLLTGILGLLMFGIALDIRVADFRRIAKSPKAPAVGLLAQFILLPLATFVFVRLADPMPSLALGMILVAACPGGNMSNFITHLAGANSALSVTMTAASSALAIVMTPFNIAFWGSLNPSTAPLLRQVDLDPLTFFLNIALILGIPLSLGMTLAARAPRVAGKIRGPLRWISLVVFGAFLVGALQKNWAFFLDYIGVVFGFVILHNAVALLLGYAVARGARLPPYDARAISIEVGIQNSGLGLVIIFQFFDGMGGLALVAATWGIWHLIAGSGLAFFWGRMRPLQLSRLSKPSPAGLSRKEVTP